MTISLSELKPGLRATIVRVLGRGEAQRRMIDMGVTPGALVEVKRVAPLGDPIEIQVKRYRLMLRKAEAMLVTVSM
jgi:Fe2+ transport system protein FeoA